MKRKNTISLTEQELYEITRDFVAKASGKHPMEFNAKLMHEISKTYSMLSSIERERLAWHEKHTNKIFFFALVSFLFLTAKILAENMAGK